jgi:peptide/nickel transport system substrate-binding protein
LAKQNLERARQLVKESGYDGRPITVVHVTDIAMVSGAALVTRELLSSIGFNVDLKAMDWSTNLAVRAKKDPPDKGGWNILHTWWMAADVMHPAVHFGVSGAGPGAWFGWPEIPQLETLITEFVRATDLAKRKQLAAEVQRVALDEVAYVPWGEYVLPTAHRKNVSGILQFIAPLFWNVSIG